MQYLNVIALSVLRIRKVKLLDGLVDAANKVFVHCELLKQLSYIFDREIIPHLFYENFQL